MKCPLQGRNMERVERDKIRKILIELGIMPNIQGHEDIINALEVIKKGPDTKAFACYAIVAEKRKAKAVSVERCIRYAIQQIDKESPVYKKFFDVPKLRLTTFLFLKMLLYGLENGGKNGGNNDTAEQT